MAKKNDAIQGGQASGQLDANSTDTARVSDQGGAGDLAGPAGARSTDELIAAGAEASLRQMADLGGFLQVEKDKFLAAYPKLVAAIDAWKASGAPEPTFLRVIAKVDGFRRAGLAHSRTGVDHPLDAFKDPEQLEAMFAEPNLVVGFV